VWYEKLYNSSLPLTLFSLLDGLSQPKQIVKKLQELQIQACALTDHGSISGCVEFLEEAKKKDVKPILGIEAYICRKDAKIKDDSNRSLDHLVILAKNDQGWKQLIKLVSDSNSPDHFYYKPRLNLEQIAEYCDGNLIGISGHLGSTIATSILDDDNSLSKTTKLIEQYREIFGRDNFYLESQLFDKENVPEMDTLTFVVRELFQKTGIPIVATPDAHYCNKEDAIDHRILLCRNLGSVTLEEAKNNNILSCFFSSSNYYIPSYEEMLNFGHTEEELENTNKVASLIEEYTDILKPPQLPTYDCPNNLTPDEYLRKLCQNGWKEKIQNNIPKENQQIYTNRIKEELNVLQGAGLSSYFLIVADILKYVRNNGWLPGPARGSAAGCLTSYLISITQVDPIPYDLLFTRFYNEARKGSLPDIDIDIPASKRDKIIEYVSQKYGQDHVAQMITFTTMKGRGALKDVLRAYGVPFYEMNEMTKHIPDEAKISSELQEMKDERGKSSIIQWALENRSDKLKDWCYIEDGELKGPFARKFEQAIRMEGTKTAQSKHAAGIVIAPKPLREMCPMVYDTKSKKQVAGLEFEQLEKIGMLKLDILGLSLLSKLMGISSILATGDIEE